LVVAWISFIDLAEAPSSPILYPMMKRVGVPDASALELLMNFAASFAARVSSRAESDTFGMVAREFSLSLLMVDKVEADELDSQLAVRLNE
jgi:hypothetical protein